MIKVCVFATLLCVARAGVIGLSGLDGYGGIGGHGLLDSHIAPIAVAHAPVAIAHAPVAVAHAPVAVAHHGAESWQNNNLISLNPTAVVTKVAAPVVTKVVSAPILTKVAAPISLGYGGYGGYGAPWGGLGH